MSSPQHTGDWNFEFEALSCALRYRAAVAAEFSAFLHGRVLEIGAGVGQMTQAFLANRRVTEVVAVEPNPGFADQFRERLPRNRLVQGTVADLPSDELCDAAVMINVLEHIEDDVGQIQQIAKHLPVSTGHLCILVPARPELYSRLDKQFGHFRRYSRRSLTTVLHAGGYVVERIHYFNLIGYVAWLTRFTLMGATHFDPSQVAFFDRWLFPPVNALERHIMRPPIGQSLIAVGRRVR